MRTLTVGTALAIVLLSVPEAGADTSSPRAGASGCARTVAPGDSIQAALENSPVGATICLQGGRYVVRARLVPRAGQAIVGIDRSVPVLECRDTYCLDGLNGPDGVVLNHLILQGASYADVRTGDRWVVRDVTARQAGKVGIAVEGSDVVVEGSVAAGNGQFGLRAVYVTSLRVVSTTVTGNPTDPSFGPGYSGGAKFNGVVGLLVQDSSFVGNGGGGGLWLDIDTQDFRLVGNTVSNNAGDDVRVEISCHGTVVGNAVAGGSGGQIDVVNSHDVTVQSNDVSAPPGALQGIRMVGNGRTTSPGTGACRTGGAYENANNQAVSNHIALAGTTTLDGVLHSGGVTANNLWSANTYVLPSCGGQQWQWWDGATQRTVNFAGWQGLGQDGAGSCSASASPVVTDFFPTSGVSGSSVTINGSGFTGATEVTFNGLPSAQVSIVSDAQVAAVVPAGATGSGPVCVRTLAGQGCSAQEFAVIVPPPPTPRIVAPNAWFQRGTFTVGWTASTGATSYEVRRHSAPPNGPFNAWLQSPVSGASAPFTGSHGRDYCFQVRAVGAGGTSRWSGQVCTAVVLDDRALVASTGGWSRRTARGLYAGTCTVARRSGAAVAIGGVEIRRLSLMVQMRPGGGTLGVYLNGVFLKRVRTASSTVQQQALVRIASWPKIRTGTITIRVLSSGASVILDGIGVSRT